MRKGWRADVPMGTLCSIDSGSSNAQDAVENAQYVLFDRSKKIKRSTRYLFDCEALIIPGEGTEFLPRHFAGKFDLHQRAYALHGFSELIDVRYLYYYLIYFKDYFPRVAVGATVKSLRRRHFENLPVVVAPPVEQQRIIAILDEAFAGLATATANAEKNLKNARELFGSYLNSVFEGKNEDWQTRPLERLCDNDRVITYGVIKLGKEIPNGVPCLRTSNVRWLRIETDGIKRISPALSREFRRTILRGGEVLVNVRGTLGGVAVAAQDMKGWNVSREVAVVPVDVNLIEPAYLAYFIATRGSQNWLTDVQKGLAYVGINIADLRTLPISFPGKEMQIQLIEQFKKLSGESRRLEGMYAGKVSQINELRQAILQAAFSGELTAPPSQAIREAAE